MFKSFGNYLISVTLIVSAMFLLLGRKSTRTITRASFTYRRSGHRHPFDEEVRDDYCNNAEIAKICVNYSTAAVKSRLVSLDILANNNTVAINKESITLVTQLSWSRIDRLLRILKHWQGPSSVSLYGDADLLSHYIKDLRKMTWSLEFPPLIHLVSQYHQDVYPTNALRNIALENVMTDYILIIDVDLIPLPRAHDLLSSYLELVGRDKKVMVIPVFEETSADAIGERFPACKADLIQLWNNGKVMPFLSTVCPGCHRSTDYNKWKEINNTYKILPSVTYEPYILAHRLNIPPYSELFVGRNFDKIQHILQLQTTGFEFHVCPDVFVIHIWHERPVTPETNRRCSRWLFERFREYLRYSIQ